ncbi:MAG: hypothetical protein M3Q56_09730 [Bacteroidota bacterium]|nr:hypothetical protein [Bacteroidota bacterium]
MRIFLSGLVILIFQNIPTFLVGQKILNQRLDSSHMWIGDQQYLTLLADSNTFSADHLPSRLDTLSWIHILDKGSWNKLENNFYERKILFTVFDSGQFSFPNLHAQSSDSNIYQQPSNLQIQVSFPLDTNAQLLPIKDIIETKSQHPLLLYIILAIILLITSLGILWFLFKADRIKPGPLYYETHKKPWEIALLDLADLESKKLIQQNQIKAYYDSMNHIIRSFLNSGFYINALESTTNEIMDKIQTIQFPLEHLHQLKENLQISDRIKFANYIPDPSFHSKSQLFAFEFIHANKDLSDQLLNDNKIHWLRLLGAKLASQFQTPQEAVPKELLQVKRDDTLEELVLVNALIYTKEFTLPAAWVHLHQHKIGIITRWHYLILNQTNQLFLRLLLLLLIIPFITLFLPFIWLNSIITKESIFSRGVFVMSPAGKLMVNYKKL